MADIRTVVDMPVPPPPKYVIELDFEEMVLLAIAAWNNGEECPLDSIEPVHGGLWFVLPEEVRDEARNRNYRHKEAK